MYIYKTTNLINTKVYIGKSEKDFTIEYLGSGTLLSKAIEKYGRENFKVEVIELCETIEVLNEREKHWISIFRGSNCYNIAEGGAGGNTMEHHPNKQEHYEKIGKKISQTLTGHPVSKEQRKKQSQSHTGWFDRMSLDKQEEYREKQRQNALKQGLGGNTFSSRSEEEKKQYSEKMSKIMKKVRKRNATTV
jgi:group I intron endonuclease